MQLCKASPLLAFGARRDYPKKGGDKQVTNKLNHQFKNKENRKEEGPSRNMRFSVDLTSNQAEIWAKKMVHPHGLEPWTR